jgi:folate-binding protein YgfZ
MVGGYHAMPSFSPEEYRAARTGAALVDRSERGRIAAIGADRLAYLHAMLTNDILSLRPGTGCYAAYLTPQGRTIADMLVLELGDLTLLDVEASTRAVVLEKLEQFIFSEDVQLSDLTSELAELRVAGPRAADVLAATFTSAGPAAERGETAQAEVAIRALPEYHSLRAAFHATSVVTVADRELGVPAFNLYLNREQAPALKDALRASGAMEIGREVEDALRIEAGRPRFGVDMDETTIPLEAGIETRAISFTKGCFPGQEVITRVLHRGHGRVAKKLVGLKCESTVEHGPGPAYADVVPAPGDALVADDREIGRVTSATMSPVLQRAIALGYVQRDFAAPGTAASIVHAGRRLPATVVDLPFVGPTPP